VPESNQSWIPDSGTITPDLPTNATSIVYYNELASLLFTTGGWVGTGGGGYPAVHHGWVAGSGRGGWGGGGGSVHSSTCDVFACCAILLPRQTLNTQP
jgi:hypothetical protein